MAARSELKRDYRGKRSNPAAERASKPAGNGIFEKNISTGCKPSASAFTFERVYTKQAFNDNTHTLVGKKLFLSFFLRFPF